MVWRLGWVEDLPFPDCSFDRVVSQFALMFFTDPQVGLIEMARVTRPGGSIAIVTWASVDQSPDLADFVDHNGRVRFPAPALIAVGTPGGERLRAVP